MKRIEYRDLKLLGATEEQLNIYSNSDPLTIIEDGGAYSVQGIMEVSGMTAADLLNLLNDLAAEDEE